VIKVAGIPRRPICVRKSKGVRTTQLKVRIEIEGGEPIVESELGCL
jgi:hypothetical protein